MSRRQTIDEFRSGGKHLPRILRDFHDQKDVFKTIHSTVELPKELANLSWVAAHIYVIDIFLWFMAKRGYTLQKSRANVEFVNINDDIKRVKDAETEALRNYLNQRKEEKTA